MSDQPNQFLAAFQSIKGQEMANSPSPLTSWLKPVVEDAEEGSLTFSFVVRNEMTNPAGTLHGGVIAAMMDDVMGATMFTLPASSFKVSINLNVDFLYAAKEGDKVFARTQVVKNGARIVNITCDLTNEAGKVLAKGYSNLLDKGQ